MSNNKELAVLARELESIIAAVGKIRHRTLVILMWSLASAVIWKVVAPGLDLAPVAERFFCLSQRQVSGAVRFSSLA